MGWFAENADLVIVLFDPNKLLGRHGDVAVKRSGWFANIAVSLLILS